jgi:mechanosensitive ion channel-like protein
MEKVDMLLEPVRMFLVHIGDFLPKLLLAFAIIVAGWLIAKAVKFAVDRGLRAVNFHIVTERAGVDAFLRQGGGDFDTTRLVALLVYWLVILAALMIAFNSLGLSYVTDLLVRILLFVSKVIVAVLILTFGAYFARFIGAAVTIFCKNAGVGDAEFIGRLALYGIMMFVVLIALDQLGVGDILRETFLILLAAVALALALAFGLGGQQQAAAFLRRWSRDNDTSAGERTRLNGKSRDGGAP